MSHTQPFFLFLVLTAPILFGVLSGLDMLIGQGQTGRYFKAEFHVHPLAPLLWRPIQVALVVWPLQPLAQNHLTPLKIVGMTLFIGAVSGAVGIVFTHELVHRRRAHGVCQLSPLFCVEHLYGHHRTVGTKGDPRRRA